ncbi:hypothetical protein DHEL01_v201467 [Diaporthe helianthi]|uniref:Uncharacterized protein n=1 Tax=Diaporthe helianthi TaxID=158607 RepID=A0A2P5IC96_DIAHE|nr:hypothetical protein DHEL01_v201467 [Diaporthe helianthi]
MLAESVAAAATDHYVRLLAAICCTARGLAGWLAGWLAHIRHSLTRAQVGALPGLQRVRQAQDGRVQQQLEVPTHLLVAIE